MSAPRHTQADSPDDTTTLPHHPRQERRAPGRRDDLPARPDHEVSREDERNDLSTTQKALRWVGVLLALYLLVCAVGAIGDGFKALGEDAARGLFDFAANPVVALFVGLLATSIIQSSSTTTSIVVAAVASGAMPLSVGIPMIMGANIGTSVTNSLASLGHVTNKREFKPAFTSATMHDFFNLLAVAILLPLELLTGFLERVSGAMADAFAGVYAPDPGEADIVSLMTDPVVDLVTGLTLAIPGVMGPVATIVLGVAMIFLAVRLLGSLLQSVMVGTARRILHSAVGKNPVVAMIAGTVVTVLVQSSSVTTSMMVPFAGSGALTPRQIYPMTLGANVGTTFTALLAAMALSGTDGAEIALQVAFVHLLFNVTGIVVIYVLPFLRDVPLRAAGTLAAVATERRSLAAVYIVGTFLAIPGLVVLASAMTTAF
ncbi:Na/Pi symporter [Mobilicoccus caccae]|uniref:Sodium:phosphate symporter n=1 Tax=Mobilicoccus caccae TaxID=1859295 RepID=A0ABQ6IV30_9MICO|nr:Na/Pi symporter [Mobilicoccus caccae]GMA41012.1 sodium:phosphate symporter [Mobilicoccus caccae]